MSFDEFLSHLDIADPESIAVGIVGDVAERAEGVAAGPIHLTHGSPTPLPSNTEHIFHKNRES
jgi:hypothetical protein